MVETTITLEPGLYVTATPVGNLADITYRAVAALKAADLILCEDTRHTAKLCAAYSIETPRAPYHDHNAERVRPGVIKKLQDGAAICLVSDAGTPLISDPGYKLVREARDHGVPVRPLPGPSAGIAALSAAGAPSDQFFFAGFPPTKSGARATFFKRLSENDGTLLLYESAQRLAAALNGLLETLGDRRAVVARELTKLHEEFREGRLSELAELYEANPPKGEIVIVIHPAEKSEATEDDLDAFLREALASASVKEAAANAAKSLGVSRKRAYDRALQLKDQL